MGVASNASTNLYPENTRAAFKNELPQSLDVTGYKITLQSISLDNNYGNIPNSVLGTRNHFLLFLGNTHSLPNPTPIAICDITDYAMLAATFVVAVNKSLLDVKTRGRIRVTLTPDKRLEITMRDAVLLVHKEVNKMFNFNSTETFVYNRMEYTKLNSYGGSKKFISQNEFPQHAITPSIIKVQLQQMCQNVSDVSLVQDLAIISVKPKTTYPFHNVCKRKEYFNLNCTRLSTVNIKLVDGDNWPLHLAGGQPTILKLQLKKFTMQSSVLRLSSLESQDVFSDNSNSSFRIKLQQPIVNSSWDVALSSIYLPSKVNITSVLTADNFYIEFSKTGIAFERVTLHDITDLTPGGFITHCTAKVLEALGSNVIVLSLDENNGINLQCTIGLAINISGMLGYLLHRTSSPYAQRNIPVQCLRASKTRYLGQLDFSKLHPHTVFVHCNFVTPIIMGNTFAQVLQVVPYSDVSEQDSVMKYEAPHLEFLPMTMNDRSTLRFEMRNSSGDLFNFLDSSIEILLTLVFREKI